MHLSSIKTSLFSAILFLQINSMYGQDSRVLGRIMEGSTRWPVQLAIIQNVSSRISTFSDTSGFFHIRAIAGDTLVFSAMGFYYSVAVVSDSLLNAKSVRQFKMEPLVYKIQEANVYSLGTYEQFKQKFIALDLSKDKTEILRRNLQHQSLTAAREADQIRQQKQSLEGVKLMSVPILTPEEKHMIMLKEILVKEDHKNRVYKKYNPDIIKKVTGITEDEEVLAFMLFCNFSDDYILNIHEYDLMVMISRKYEEYCRLKEGKGSDEKSQIPFIITISGFTINS
jgi:hypothetical protein